MNQCVTCKTMRSLLELTIAGNEDNGGEDYSLRVCDTCWEAIAGIAQRANNWKFSEMQKKLDAMEEQLGKLLSQSDLQESVAIWGTIAA